MKQSLKTSLVLGSLAALPACVMAQEAAEVKLEAFVVYSTQVANQEPVGTFAMPVSLLRFDPKVDVQARNFAEGQADIAIRGGIFENTGIRVGAVSLYDPQTGHYAAEVPIAPMLLGAPEVLTGADQAQAGFNASVGTISYGFKPINKGGFGVFSFGQHNSNAQELYEGVVKELSNGRKLAADVDLARSESDGPIAYGDHDFKRVNARLQYVSGAAQTDLVAAYQDKFFGWPNLYTPYNVNESESIQTLLFLLNHRIYLGGENYVQAAAFWRQNDDDYEFNRLVPGLYNPYEHRTVVHGYAIEGRHDFGSERFALNFSARAMFDRITSTSLVFGPFRHRDYYKFSVVPETWVRDGSGNRYSLKAGIAYDDTNRDAGAWSPVVQVERTGQLGALGSRLWAGYSSASQVASYTALKSNPNAGLFRGNANLGRSSSDNFEVGAEFSVRGWKFASALFLRQDRDLVDWTYSEGVTARSANAVDVDTLGLELSVQRSWKRVDLVLGYAALSKDSNYGSASVDASFYALNFPRHRLTAAVVARLGAGFELRVDNEARVQEENLLRRGENSEYFLTSAGLSWSRPELNGLKIALQVDNLWNSEFQEVPAVPASPRVASLSVSCRW